MPLETVVDTVATAPDTTSESLAALQNLPTRAAIPSAATAALGRLLSGPNSPASKDEMLRALATLLDRRDRTADWLVQALVAGTDTDTRALACGWHCAGLENLGDDAWNELLNEERRAWLETACPGVPQGNLTEELRQRAAPLVANWTAGEPLEETDQTFLARLVSLDAAVRRLRAGRAVERASGRGRDLTPWVALWRTQADDRARMARRLADGEAVPDPMAATSRLREAVGPEGMAELRAAAGADPALGRLARVLRSLDQDRLGVPSPARGVGLLLAMAREPGEVPLVAADPDPLLMAAFVLERGVDGVADLPLPPGRGDEARRRDVELPAGVRLTDNTVHVDCGAADAPETGPDNGGKKEIDQSAAALKELVLNNMQSTSAILAFLRDAKITSIPGLVEEIVNRTRNPQILETIATDRTLHGGFANRTVPLALLKSPVNVSIKILRRFAHVKYVSKIDLKRMATDKSGIRKDVGREIEKYLSTLA